MNRDRQQLTTEEIIRRLSRIEPDVKYVCQSSMAASDLSIAIRRLESLVETGLISCEEKALWDRRLDDDEVSLADVERFVARKRASHDE